MTIVRRSALPRILLAAVLLAILSFPPPAAAQPVDRPSAEERAPKDDFQSAGIGLTREELTAWYGPYDVGQGSIFSGYQGVDLHKVGCDLILSFPRDGSAEPVDETALVESLLPADAEPVGTFALGTTIAEFAGNTLWRSPSLAARFAALGEERGALIQIVSTYEPMGPAVYRVDLRVVAILE